MLMDWKKIEDALLLRNVSTANVPKVFKLDRDLPLEELQERFLNCILYGNYLEVIRYFDGSMLEHKSLVEAILTEDDLFLAIKSFLLCHLEDDGEEERGKTLPWRVFEVFALGIAYLELYSQCNYTGPELSRQERAIIDAAKEEETKAARFQLECDGNFAHHTADMPHLLLFSRIILSLLSNPSRGNWKQGITLNENGVIVPPTLEVDQQFRQELVNGLKSFTSLAWWNARAVVLHSRLLLSPSYDTIPTLWNEVTNSFQSALISYGAALPTYDLLKGDPIVDNHTITTWNKENRMIASKIWLEWGLACHHFAFTDKGKKKFHQSKEISQLDIYLTAALGKRTKYQREDIAQLILYAKSSFDESLPGTTTSKDADETTDKQHELKVGEEENPNEYEIGRRVLKETTTGEEVATREILLDQVNTGAAENIILEGGPRFQNPEEVQNGGSLHPLDQSIVLAFCLDVSNSNPIDGLTNEEMLPYVEKVLKQPINWMIHSTALLQRSWIEFERRKTADRAMLQIQALIDQHSTKLTITQSSYQSIEESAKIYERIEYIYNIIYPSQFELKKDLAIKYLQCQIFQSSLIYLKELQLWDEVVLCYQLMNKPAKAEMVVREQLKIVGETPYMMTALADITGNEALYERAWVLSQGRYPRAKRTLGKICYDRGDFQAAINHLNDALTVQPLVHTAWYLKGIACMRVEAWEDGIQAFVRCVQLESEVAEAWTNLGAIYMRQSDFMKAYHSFQEAMKSKSDDYRIIENLLTVTLALEKWKESIQHMNTLIDLRFKVLAKQQQTPSSSSATAAVVHYRELRFLAKLLPQLLQQHQLKKSHLFDDKFISPATTAVTSEEDETVSTAESEEKRREKIQGEYDVQTIRLTHLIEDFEKLCNKIVMTLRSDPDMCDIIAEFQGALGESRIAYDYRVKQVILPFKQL